MINGWYLLAQHQEPDDRLPPHSSLKANAKRCLTGSIAMKTQFLCPSFLWPHRHMWPATLLGSLGVINERVLPQWWNCSLNFGVMPSCTSPQIGNRLDTKVIKLKKPGIFWKHLASWPKTLQGCRAVSTLAKPVVEETSTVSSRVIEKKKSFLQTCSVLLPWHWCTSHVYHAMHISDVYHATDWGGSVMVVQVRGSLVSYAQGRAYRLHVYCRWAVSIFPGRLQSCFSLLSLPLRWRDSILIQVISTTGPFMGPEISVV